MPETLRSLVRPNMSRGPAARRDLTGVRSPFRPGRREKSAAAASCWVCGGCVSAEQIVGPFETKRAAVLGESGQVISPTNCFDAH